MTATATEPAQRAMVLAERELLIRLIERQCPDKPDSNFGNPVGTECEALADAVLELLAAAPAAPVAKPEPLVEDVRGLLKQMRDFAETPTFGRVLVAEAADLIERLAAQPQAGEVERIREALEWYGEQARLARLIHSEGDAGRHALAADGGKRARRILTASEQPQAAGGGA